MGCYIENVTYHTRVLVVPVTGLPMPRKIYVCCLRTVLNTYIRALEAHIYGMNPSPFFRAAQVNSLLPDIGARLTHAITTLGRAQRGTHVAKEELYAIRADVYICVGVGM